MAGKILVRGYLTTPEWGTNTAGTVATADLTDQRSNEVFIQAAKANGGTLYLGFGTALTTSNAAVELLAGDWATLPVANPASIFMMGNDASQDYNFAVFD